MSLFYKDVGLTLYKSGYEPIPVEGKAPKSPNWQKIKITEQQVTSWAANGAGNLNVGIRTGQGNTAVYAIDLDIYIKSVAEKLSEAFQNRFGTTLMRVGQEPKLMLLYRGKPGRKKITVTYDGKTIEGSPIDAKTGKPKNSGIEILGLGQQFVAYGIHPETNRPYQWPFGGLDNNSIEALPEIDIDDVAIWLKEQASKLVPPEWELVGKKAKQVDQVTGEIFEQDPLNAKNSLKEFNINYLEKINQWIHKLGYPVHQYDGYWRIKGKDLPGGYEEDYSFHEKGIVDFRVEDQGDPNQGKRTPTQAVAELVFKDPSKWMEARDWLRNACGDAAYKKPSVDISAEEFEQERRERQRKENIAIGEGANVMPPKAETLTLEKALKRFVFLTDGSQVVDAFRPQFPMAYQDFENTYSASKVQIQSENIYRPKFITVARQWKVHPDRMTAESITFKAGDQLLVKDPKGRLCVNTWTPYDRTMEVSNPQEHEVDLFINHIKMLWPEDWERFMEWLAHIEQKPGELPSTAHLHVSIQQGMGRNWLASVLSRLWSGKVAASLSIDEIEGNYNGRLGGRVLAIVDEVNEGGNNKFQNSEKLKSRITAETTKINPKYGRSYEEHNACRLLFFSNDLTALPIGDKDRRIEAVVMDTKPKGKGYYNALYSALRKPTFIAAVAKYLGQYDLSKFEPGRHAKQSKGRALIQNHNKTTLDIALERVKEFWPCDIVAVSDLGWLVTSNNNYPVSGDSMRSGAVKHAFERAGIKTVPTKVIRFPIIHKGKESKPTSFYILRNYASYVEDGGFLIKENITEQRDTLLNAFEKITPSYHGGWLTDWILDQSVDGCEL
ncbi:DUF5906 domain-containing protein [Polynucleobacter asymbioticus]|uniref:DUF5906 domain-containing protein n=1 Tax=Polynucleobacter asymbioticus TaxID=576611 RepID=UPI0008F91556|nr:DUF5906 domain-containing protein [Polynucleobacter asymbioticus]